MSKFTKWSTFKQVYNTLYSRFIYNRRIAAVFEAKTQQFKNELLHGRVVNPPITRAIFEGFEDHSCLARWGEVSDMEFGGTSKASLMYNSILGYAILKGKISTEEQDKLETLPFIGMIQKLPISLKLSMFNCLRVQLQGDGHPVVCEIRLQSWSSPLTIGRATILTSNDDNLTTYQIPFRNFHISDMDAMDMFKKVIPRKLSIGEFIDDHNQLRLQSISFRLISRKQLERKVEFKKIELIRSIRGNRENKQNYKKPYFYIVDDNKEQDEIIKNFNIGSYEIFRSA